MKTVAVVDDALLIRLQLKKFFEETMKFTVVAEGSNGSDAVNIFEKHKPDLMTLDLTMPNMGGLQALEEIFALTEDARILVITAIKQTDQLNKAISLGAKSYVLKPLQFNNPTFVENFKEEIGECLQAKA
ncbi:MAG: response regulator [Oligoflexales bacterium]